MSEDKTSLICFCLFMNTKLKKKKTGKDVAKGRHYVGIIMNQVFFYVTTKQAYPYVICSVSSLLVTKVKRNRGRES